MIFFIPHTYLFLWVEMDRAKEILKHSFGYDTFRPMQEKVIRAALNNEDILVLMPTGGGKSLCFQIPALIKDGVTIVVSPLIALMRDQVEALKSNGVTAAFINSSQSQQEQEVIIEHVKNKRVKLLYISPEKLVSQEFNYLLLQIKPVLFAIDEAHCISSWGHDFRPEYSRMGFLKKQFKNTPIMALTATADPLTRDDICRQLKLDRPSIFQDTFDRPNISIQVLPGRKKFERIVEFLRVRKSQAGIIYCLSKQNTEKLALQLKSIGYKAGFYHAGLEPYQRSKIQDDFINDKLDIVCATIAFGMGIDKSNVRWVIHYNLPKNIESYYQEIGRAGRDGLPANTLLFYSKSDYNILASFNEASNRQHIMTARLDWMQKLAEARTCRKKVILNYFGEWTSKNCENCDVCKNPPQLVDTTILAQKALSAVYRLEGQANSHQITHVLKGIKSADIEALGFHQIKTFGVGGDLSIQQWHYYLDKLVQNGMLRVAYDQNNNLQLTPLSGAVLFENQSISIVPEEQQKNQPSNTKLQEVTKPVDYDIALFEKLRALRRKLAVEHGVPPYILFSDATLREMSIFKPTNEWSMKEISGVGDKKYEQYGDAFISEINNYLKKESKSPLDITFDYYKKGIHPNQIAVTLHANILTIYSHLGALYERGEDVKILNYVSIDEIRFIETVKLECQSNDISKIYNQLNGTIPHYKIRLALSWIKVNNIN